VFNVLRILQKFIIGDRAFAARLQSLRLVFQDSDLTRWQTSELQKFELEIHGNGGIYQYTLEVEHLGEYAPPRMRLESLTFDGQPLFDFWVDAGDEQGMAIGQARLYNDDPNREGNFFTIL
jgi:hypothetical protein